MLRFVGRAFCLGVGMLALNVWAATPFIDLVSPPSAGVGWGPMSITIGGVNFAPSARVSFGGTVLNPDTVTPTQISVTIPYKNLQQAGTASIAVVNPAAAGGNGVSNAVAFPVRNESVPVAARTHIPRMFHPSPGRSAMTIQTPRVL